MKDLFGIKGKLGFGCMRMKNEGGKVDLDEFCKMVDTFLENGFNYFDTARGYLGGESEKAICACLTSRYPREAFVLTDKLSENFFKTEADIRPYFEDQLKSCGVSYFDFYLMHAQNRNNYSKYRACRAYENALAFLKEGKIKHFGISFHDTADVLEQILSDYPQIEVVQLQFNYLDYEDNAVQSRRCYEVCRAFGKPVLVMEPVKGGRLAKNLSDAAKAELDLLQGGSYASYAIRYAAGFEGVLSVLSGMENVAMVADNVSYMKNFKPLDAREQAAVSRVAVLLRGENTVPCTACKYCTEVCPVGIGIPEIISTINSMRTSHSWSAKHYYKIFTGNAPRASACIACGKCEKSCPQHLPIRELMREATSLFEKE